jgi:predicted nuclease of predicted toxin-antitoxin system
MKMLFDEGVPQPLSRHCLAEKWTVDSVVAKGWSGRSDADVLQSAEKENYDVFITTDKNIVHQQNLKKLKIQVYTLPTTSWPKLKGQAEKIVSEIRNLVPGREDTDKLSIDE